MYSNTRQWENAVLHLKYDILVENNGLFTVFAHIVLASCCMMVKLYAIQ